MGTMACNRIGLAGELRVMSELLLRGHNPAKSYLEEGADLVLENGLRVEVKTGHFRPRGKGTVGMYQFTLKGGGRRRPQNLSACDYLILWCLEDDCFFIVPTSILIESQRVIGITKLVGGKGKYGAGKYLTYQDRWEQLNEVKKDGS